MKQLPVVFLLSLLMSVAFAQDAVPYVRHDAYTGQTLLIPLDAGCLDAAGQPAGGVINLSPHKDRQDYESAQTLAAAHCTAILLRELMQRLDDLEAALAGEG